MEEERTQTWSINLQKTIALLYINGSWTLLWILFFFIVFFSIFFLEYCLSFKYCKQISIHYTKMDPKTVYTINNMEIFESFFVSLFQLDYGWVQKIGHWSIWMNLFRSIWFGHWFFCGNSGIIAKLGSICEWFFVGCQLDEASNSLIFLEIMKRTENSWKNISVSPRNFQTNPKWKTIEQHLVKIH